jgi:DNA/RNA-binding domain of Phe-tRNA-synthetase-like protein
MRMLFEVDADWNKAFPGAHAGILVLRGAANPPGDPGLQAKKSDLETRLRARFAGADRAFLLNLPELRAYDAYYRRFKKTYHIQLQLESILFKGKSIPTVAALVEAMFMAEMEDLLLTAGHDLDALQPPVCLGVSAGNESYTLLRGEEQALKPGDMCIRDARGVISSVIYGPDRRTRITPETKNVLFTTYAPAGIPAETVQAHLENIGRTVRVFAPNAVTDALKVYPG